MRWRGSSSSARRAGAGAAVALVLVCAAVGVAAPATGALAGGGSPPARLADTGLYSDFASRTVDARNLPYSPQYPLWSDGAAKARWIYVPPGAAIDASDPEVWKFPVGTKLWKEFAWSRRVETRYLERTRRGWTYASYLWTEDGRDARLAPQSGALSSYEVAPGRRHPIPAVADCKNCHRGGRSEVLGFAALQLSPDRDPLAPHAEPVPAGGVTLPDLVQRGLVRRLPRELIAHPPRIEASSPRARAALGYLHANCGNCHDTVGPLASIGLSLRYPVRPPADDAPGPLAAVERPSRFQVPGTSPGQSRWLAPGAPARSVVAARMASRNPIVQMPPLGTQLVDGDAVALLSAWIEHDLRPPSGGVQQQKQR